MKLWQDLVSAAIVGTDRQKINLPSAGADRLTSVLSGIETDDDETVLLKTAAVLSAYRRAGIKTASDKQSQAETPPKEIAAKINERAAQHLAGMLSGNHANVLPEFFGLIGKHKQILPPRFLPEILDLGNDKRDLRNLLLPIIGERGRWLAEQNASWRWALVEKNAEEFWDTGINDERIFALEFWRRQNPDEARRQLAEDWKSESAKNRAAFLETLQINLASADETFLHEILRGDKSADARRTAFNLLVRLPDSNLVRELDTRARRNKIIELRKNGIFRRAKIEVNLPENFGQLEKEDVLNSCALELNQTDLGLKAVNLAKLLSAVSPIVWEQEFSASPAEIIEAAKTSEWHQALLSGFGFAAERFQNLIWLKETIRLTYDQTNQFYPFYANRWGMPENLSSDLIEALFFELGGNDLVFAQIHKSEWSDRFTRHVVDAIKNEPGKTREQKSKPRNFAYGLKDFALFMSINLNDELQNGWSFQPDDDKHLEIYVNQFLEILRFRREIHDSFEEKK